MQMFLHAADTVGKCHDPDLMHRKKELEKAAVILPARLRAPDLHRRL
jgi:hypothetical protein